MALILGQFRPRTVKLPRLQDFVRESNRGDTVWFAPDLAALERRLAERRG